MRAPCWPAWRRPLTDAPTAPRIFIDADACPVKEEIYKVARRYQLKVFVVSNAFMIIPKETLIERVIVDAGPDIADDWIADQSQAWDIVITNDIPLAGRALEKGALVLGSKGKPFTPDSIGMALAGRSVGEHLRSMGEITRGPAPFGPQDRSRFLAALDEAVNRAKRRR